MPFTFSHPALILPATFLPKKTYSLTGLVIGSMVPDFEYFIRLGSHGQYGHTIPGLFFFDLPVGLLIAFAYHLVVRDQLIDHMPGWLHSRLNSFKTFDWNRYFHLNWYIVIPSIIFGAITHLFWDSFTHDNGYFVRVIPGMHRQIEIFGFTMVFFRFLQHLSTVVGGTVIFIVLLRMREFRVPVKPGINLYWSTVTFIALIITVLRVAIHPSNFHYHEFIITIISGWLIGLMITPWMMQTKQ